MKSLLDFLKLPAHILGALALASGFLLIVSDGVIQTLRMGAFMSQYGFWVGVVFLVSVAILLVLPIKSLGGFVCRLLKEYVEKKKYVKLLNGLEENEVELINRFLKEPTNTLELSMNNGIVSSLYRQNVIDLTGFYQVAPVMCSTATYFLLPWVRNLIKEEKQLQKIFCIENHGRS